MKNNQSISGVRRPSYLEYILNEEEYKLSEKMDKSKEFWSKVFDTVPEFCSFKSNSSTSSTKANRKRFILSPELSDNIKSFCGKMKISIFPLFISAFSIYLSRRTGCEDLVIGTPVLNRSGVKEKETLGMFINSIP
jgi:hypothetical protein